MSEGSNSTEDQVFDLFVIGGGINGCGIARDAQGRGLSVALAEMDDLGSSTSSASTKLFHGGLRYLEYFEFRLVREALKEREVLLRAMPHISWPMRFVLPYHPDMRFAGGTPTSRLLTWAMPWMKGRRPAWLIRFGLFLYDHLGGRELLPGTTRVDLAVSPEGRPLKPKFRHAYEYSDCWVQDSRLVVLNARDAAARGARIMTRTRVVGAKRGADNWTVVAEFADGTRKSFRARCLVNAGGPWVSDVLKNTLGINSSESIRLVRGSHIVTRKLYDHEKCYFFQGRDGRIIFAIPYEEDFTLIGTTDQDHAGLGMPPRCTEAESDYLREFAAEYFERAIEPDDIVWTFSGVRPLYDDGASSATAATREYVLSLDENGAPLLSVFGGKITTYRKLAEVAMAKLAPLFQSGDEWTAGAPLPGGDFPVGEVGSLIQDLCSTYPFLSRPWAKRLIRTYGTEAASILGDARTAQDLGLDFGATVTEREIDWAVDNEWVRSADDFLWRRTKTGLRISETGSAKIQEHVIARLTAGFEKDPPTSDRSQV